MNDSDVEVLYQAMATLREHREALLRVSVNVANVRRFPKKDRVVRPIDRAIKALDEARFVLDEDLPPRP